MKLPPFYDIIGACVTLILLAAVVAYPLCGKTVPQEVLTPFSVAMGWVFRSATGAANDFMHRERSNGNGQPPSG
jgi:hypothetical protein